MGMIQALSVQYAQLTYNIGFGSRSGFLKMIITVRNAQQ